MNRVAIIGIGNTLMGDDGIGVRVAEALESAWPDAAVSGVHIVSGHTAGMGLMPEVLDARLVVFVDAIDTGDSPGSVYRFDPDSVGLGALRSNTSHGVGIPHLITGARLHGHWPQFVVYGVQIGDLMCGPDRLSDAVDAAIGEVVALIGAEVGLPAAPLTRS